MTTYRPDIDGLRAVSIGLVVAYHAGVDAVAGGYVGVDVFLVVSGFLITGLLIAEFERTGTVSLRQFVARRARRLLPLAGVVLTVTAVLGAWLMAPLMRPRLFDDVRAAALFVANWRFAGQATDYSDVTAADSLVNHWWSLAVEEQFYLVWPLVILGVGIVAARRRAVPVRAALAFVIGVVLVASLIVSVVLTSRLGPEAYYVTHARLWELAFGALLATVLTGGRRSLRVPRWVREIVAAAGLSAVVASALVYDAATPFPGWAAVVPVVGTGALIVAGASGTTAIGRLLGLRPFTRLGHWSYAWYLWHWPVIGLALIAADRWAWSLDGDVVTAAAVALSLVLAAASHRFIENPVRRASWLAVLPRRSMAVGLIVVTVPVATATTFDAVLDADGGALVVAAGVVAMTPEEAAADVVSLPRSDDCNATLVEDTIGIDCVFGDRNGQIDIVLLGDSHAQQWLPALDTAGQQRGWRVHAFTKSACAAFQTPLRNNTLERTYRECATWHQLVAERLAAIDADMVVLANTHAYADLMLDDRGRRIDDAEEARAQWTRVATENLTRLLQGADTVVRLHDTPWSPRDVPTCLSASASQPERCAFPLEGRSGRDALLLEAERAAVTAGGLGERHRFVDPTALVCPDDPCEVLRGDGTVVFRDEHHLTQTFSRSLADDLAAALEQVLVARR